MMNFRNITWLAVAVATFVGSGCSATFPSIKLPHFGKAKAPQRTYDYSPPPARGSTDSRPVWILPVINSGYQPPKVDARTGEWVGGHYSASIVTPGKWATQEEAELSGKPYILPGQTKPIVPVELRSQAPDSTGELNATTLEQKLARLEKYEHGKADDSASRTSLGNQISVPSIAQVPKETVLPEPEPPKVASGKTGGTPMNIPGITEPAGKTKEPKVLAQPPLLPPPPPPLAESGVAAVPKKASGTAPKDASGTVPKNLTQPTASYDAASSKVIVSYGDPGTAAKVVTPKGEVVVTYGENGVATVSFGGKQKTVTITGANEQVKITIPK